MSAKKLSIVIPYYNAGGYTRELLDRLAPQISEFVEVILVDDGSKIPFETDYEWCQVIHKKNGGCATARNAGLNKAQGDYVSFIDADDLVAEDFVVKVIEKTKDEPDVIDLSWKSLTKEGVQHNYKLADDRDWLPNPSVCTRVFKRSFIGDVRFNEQKDSTEDEDFSRKVGYLDKNAGFKHMSISDYMYFYRTAVENSKIKRFKQGLMKTKRIVYYYDHVTSDMTYLIDEIKKEDEINEVWLLTNQCDIPELRRWCQVHKPIRTWTHYLRGEAYKNIEIVELPYRTQIVLYINSINVVGGITTFVYHFGKVMGKFFDVTYVVNNIPEDNLKHLQKVMKVLVKPRQKIICDVLIMLRIQDELPLNIEYKKSIQMCHACKAIKNWHIPQHCDFIVNVSQASKDSFKEEAENSTVIHNLITPPTEKPLILMSATRLPAADKGGNEKRMFQLANMLNDAKIDFIWINFSDGQLVDPPKNFYNMGLKMNASKYFGMASYVVQLSSCEAWSYSILEALTQNVPVLVCPFESAYEMGIEEGKNGYYIPFDMDFDIKKILQVPEFEYEYSNDMIVAQWKKLFKQKPPEKKLVKVRVTFKKYYDVILKKEFYAGDIVEMVPDRARYLQDEKKLVEIL